MHPESLRLAQVKWDFFTTLTFPQRWVDGKAPAVVAKTFFAFLREVAVILGVPFHQLLWASRSERGELTGRPHYHALIAGKRSHATEAARWAIRAIWKKHSGAFADSRLFDPTLRGVAYVLKSGTYTDGANQYEMGKFTLSPDTVTLSRSVHAAMRGRIAADVRDAG